MTFEERCEWVRQKVSDYPRYRILSKPARGSMIGRVSTVIKSAADLLGLPVSNARRIRLVLATVVFQCPIESYNDLGNAELWALDQWARKERTAAITELKDWLGSQYGGQEELPLSRPREAS